MPVHNPLSAALFWDESKVFREQPDVPISENATIGGTTIVDLSTVSFRYVLRALTLKSADPGAETVTVTLIKLVNDIETTIDSFVIDTTNYQINHELIDMFGDEIIHGDLIKIICTSSVGEIAMTGQYSHAQSFN